jgi:hypothetical protein
MRHLVMQVRGASGRVDWMISCRSERDAAGASSTVWVGIRLIAITSYHSWLAECVRRADVLHALEKRVPILCLRP